MTTQRPIYDPDKFESFAVSRACIPFETYYNNYYNNQRRFYSDRLITFDDTYFERALTPLNVWGNYCSMFWMKIRPELASGRSVRLVYIAALIDYIAEVLADFIAYNTRSSVLFMKLEGMKVLAYNKKSLLRRELTAMLNRGWRTPDFDEHNTNLLKISHQRLASTAQTVMEFNVEPPVVGL